MRWASAISTTATSASALEHLTVVYKNNPKYNESELARMLLWIYTSPKFYDARKIVDLFEVLRERYPQLEIPYDKILVVGQAYTDIGEFERSWLVYRAAIAASFNNDSAISAVLEDEGRFLGSIDFQERIWREYPDTAEVVTSYFALSQLLYQKAPKAHELPKEDNVQPENIAMLKRTADLLFSFLAMYPKDPLADNAGFSLANCLLTLKNYPLVVSLSNEFAKRYSNSPLAPGFQYMTALGLFWQNQYADALAAARIVADGDSKDRDFARYILGQIYHAESKPKEAIDWYDKVKQLYPDAAEAIAYFEKKSIALDEVTVVKPGQPVELTLKYRNIKEASLQVYRVDLMKLYLQQKNLSAITRVQLAGIRPELEQIHRPGRRQGLRRKGAQGLPPVEGRSRLSRHLPRRRSLHQRHGPDHAAQDRGAGGQHQRTRARQRAGHRQGRIPSGGPRQGHRQRRHRVPQRRNRPARPVHRRQRAWQGHRHRPRGRIPLRLLPRRDLARRAAECPRRARTQPALQGQQIDYLGNLNFQNSQIQQLNNDKFNLQRRQAPSKGVQTKQAF